MQFFKKYFHGILKQIIQSHGLISPFLEVGCGTGETLAFLGELGFHGMGIDFSPYPVEQARRKVATFPKITVEQRDLLEIGDISYTFVLCVDVIEHIKDDVKALQEIGRILKPGGKAVILVPTGKYMKDDVWFGHYRRYSQADIQQKIRQAGLKIVDRWTVGYPLLHYVRLCINRCVAIPVPNQTTDDEFIAQTKQSSYAHPYQETFPARLLRAVESRASLNCLLNRFLSLQNVFRRWPTGHGVIVVAERSLTLVGS